MQCWKEQRQSQVVEGSLCRVEPPFDDSAISDDLVLPLSLSSETREPKDESETLEPYQVDRELVSFEDSV